MPTMRNESQIQSVLMSILEEILVKTEDEIREKLVYYIRKKTYQNDYFPNKYYQDGDGTDGSGEPSYEFEQAWEWNGMKVSKKELSDKLYYGWRNMTVDRLLGRHWEDGRDTRESLAEMMNVSDIVGYKEREPYWDIFINEINNKIYSMWKKELISKGLKIV